MRHKLVIDEFVEDSGEDGEEGYGSVEDGIFSVCMFVRFNDFCDFEWVWVLVVVDRCDKVLSLSFSSDVLSISRRSLGSSFQIREYSLANGFILLRWFLLLLGM